MANHWTAEQSRTGEFECLMFLAHEWDFGGLIEAPTSEPSP